MSTRPVSAPGSSLAPETANDQLKRGWESWFWGSMMAAIAFHFTIFAFWPQMTAEDVAMDSNELEAIDIPPEVEIPPPPEAIQRPATPVIAEAHIDEDITIAPTTFEENPIEMLPPPPDASNTGGQGTGPRFIPFDVSPVLQNRGEVARVLQREYPPILRESGIGGVVTVWFYIDENGVVQERQVNQSSGYDAFDAAALEVADVMKFSPAQNRDKRTAVWVSIPITFSVGR
ncbi:MAG: energy transducer TonB [Longimicrobiales bacterium]|nr:energy transducer TonB [Longimicrobiales bacterium]